MKVQIKEAYAYEGPAVQYTGEDGYPDAVIMPVLVAITTDGRMFQLPNGLVHDYDDDGFGSVRPRWNICKADEMAAEVIARKFINAEHWVETSEKGLRDYSRGSYHC